MRLLRKALRINASFAPALAVMGELLRCTGHHETSYKFYKQVLKNDNHNLSALKGLFEACCNIGLIEEAPQHLEAILKLNTDLTASESDLLDESGLRVKLGLLLRESD